MGLTRSQEFSFFRYDLPMYCGKCGGKMKCEEIDGYKKHVTYKCPYCKYQSVIIGDYD